MKKLILKSLFLPAVLLIAANFTMAQDTLKDTTESKYKVGQMWSYKTRPNEEESRFIVVKVENHSKYGNIIHIALINLKIKNPRSPDGISERANHLPFSEKAIDDSAIKVVKEKVDLPDYEEGYNLWRKAFDAKQAGFYTTVIAKVVETMEAGLNQ